MTPDQFKAWLAEFGARIAAAETRLTWRFAGALLAQTVALAAIMAALLRVLASS